MVHGCRRARVSTLGPRLVGLAGAIVGLVGAMAGAAECGSIAQAVGIAAERWDVPKNTVLIYYRWGLTIDREALLPYVAYVNREGEPQAAPFFDGFLFLSISDRTSPGWEEALFTPGRMLAALDEAAAEVQHLQHDGDFRYRVYLSLPVLPGTTADEKASEARRFIDETRRRFRAAGYRHLQLAGYYWFDEGIRDPVNRQAAEKTAAYLHSLTGIAPLERPVLQLVWIPYDVGHPNRPQVQEWRAGLLPMDAVWLQPNFLWAERGRGYDRQDLDETVRFALATGASVEVEYDGGVPVSGWKTARYRHYLASGRTYGYASLPLAYYEGGGAYRDAALIGVPAFRQLYEDTFAFSRGVYEPRSLILGQRWIEEDGEVPPASRGSSYLADLMLPQGLWLGKGENPQETRTLRLAEPDPNQSYWLIVTFKATTTGDCAAAVPLGRITLETFSGEEVEIGTYPLDGKLHTRWYLIPGELLRRDVPAVPTQRLVYRIHFSTPVRLIASWARSDQTVPGWQVDVASFWSQVDPRAYPALEGREVPGVRWDAGERQVVWAGMDDSRALLVGIETSDGLARTYPLPAGAVMPDGSGTFRPEDLPEGAQVRRVWAQPADIPFHLAIGAEGDTAAPFRQPGVAIVPESGWSFAGQPIGVSRRLAGRGSMRVVVPDTGRPYSLTISLDKVSRLEWTLRSVTDETRLASGTVAGGERKVEIPITAAGTYEVIWVGSGSFLEAWLAPNDGI